MEIDNKEKDKEEQPGGEVQEDRRPCSDRIALITGRTQNLPSPPQQPHSSPVSDGDNREIDQIKGHSDGEGATGLPRYENVIASPGRSGEIHEEDHSQALVLDNCTRKPAKYRRLHPPPQPTFFSLKRLNQCIVESEVMRALSALAIAVLVVFSNADGTPGGFVSSRPFVFTVVDRCYDSGGANALPSTEEPG